MNCQIKSEYGSWEEQKIENILIYTINKRTESNMKRSEDAESGAGLGFLFIVALLLGAAFYYGEFPEPGNLISAPAPTTEPVRAQSATPQSVPTQTSTPNITPIITPVPTPLQTPLSEKTLAVSLYGEKTNVIVGDDIILKLSATHLISQPPMSVQVLLYPPSGMSVTSADFVASGTGIYSTSFEIDGDTARHIDVHIKSNQAGDFIVRGEVVYYSNGNTATAKMIPLELSVHVI